MNRLGYRLGLLLFLSSLFIPTTYQRPKYVLLLVLLVIAAVSQLRRVRLGLDPVVLLITMGLSAAGLAFLALGEMNGAAPGALKLATIYVLWPLVMIFLAAAVDRAFLEQAQRLLVVATLMIGAHMVLFAASTAGWLPAGPWLAIDVGQQIGLYEGYVEISANYTATLLFTIPYFVATLLLMPGTPDDPVSRRWAGAGLAVGLALVLMSGRRGLLAAAAVAPLVALGLASLVRRDAPWLRRVSIPRTVAAIGVVVVLVAIYLQRVYSFSFAVVADQFLRGFEFWTGDESAIVRGEQWQALLAGWAESPLFGWGYGTSAPGSLRSVEFPWSYELSYLSLLFHTGVAGLLLYGAAVAWLYVNALRAVRSGVVAMRPLLPILVGTTCFLIGNATNPYLEKFDFLWVLFLPLMYVNQWRLARGPAIAQPHSRA